MKKLLPIILLITTTGILNSQTNVYHAFPTTDGFWHQKDNSTHYQFGIMGDTVINNLTWHKIYVENNCNIFPVMTSANSTFVGGLREDSIKRVFFYTIGNTSSINNFLTPNSVYKLYDFSAQAGDTVHFTQNTSPNPYNAQYYVVDNIDSTYTYNQYRKRFHLSSLGFPFPETWIEGIGSLRSLFSIITPYPTCSCYINLFCFKSNNIAYYIKTPYQDCYDENVNVTEFKNTEDQITIFPNPFEEETIISFGHYASDFSIIVYNTFGQQVKQINRKSGVSVNLECGDLSQGMYYCYVIENGKKNSTHKFVIKNK